MTHFDNISLLSQYQQGFRSKHICESQRISFTQKVHYNLENAKQTEIILVNFSKAFDKVDHNKLIYKLLALGIHLMITQWIMSFLHSHSQRVVVDGCTSDIFTVLSGLPHCTVLGLCFLPILIYIINDCPKPISFIPYIAYPISHSLYRIPKKFQNFIKFQKFSKIIKQWPLG